MQPLLPWDSKIDDTHSQIVWRIKLDHRYLIEIHRIDDCYGKLYVFDHDKNDEEIASWDVTLSDGAVFGPDENDVIEWQKKILDFVDNTYNK